MTTQIDLSMYCSVESQKSNLDASWIKLSDNLDFYLMFELKMPWNKWIEHSSYFPKGLQDYFEKIKKEGKKFKYFCIKPKSNDTNETKDEIRVFYFKGNSTGSTSFEKIELLLPKIKLLNIVKMLVENDKSCFEKYEVPFNNTRDIFVCTHQERDQCCGKFGIDIFQKINSSNFESETSLKNLIKVWQSSHMGGHRVGPTFMDMPSGRIWAYLSEDVVNGIINQNVDHINVLKCYRGTMGLDRYSQIVDKEIFALDGWGWLDVQKSSEIISQNEKETKVKISYTTKTESGEYSATVLNMGKIVFPATLCSKSTSMTKFEVKDLEHVIY